MERCGYKLGMFKVFRSWKGIGFVIFFFRIVAWYFFLEDCDFGVGLDFGSRVWCFEVEVGCGF